MQEEQLFKELLSKLEQLADYWDAQTVGKTLTHHEFFLGTEEMSPHHISEAVRLMRKLYSEEPQENLSSKIKALNEEWDILFDIWKEFLSIGDDLKAIAYAISRFYRKYRTYIEEHDPQFLAEEIKKADLILKSIKS